MRRSALDDHVALLHDQLAAILGADPDGEHGTPLADALLASAVAHRATDIHLDPSDLGLVLRLRIDGALRDAAMLSWDDAPRLINQLKVLAGIDPLAVFHPEEARWTHRVGDDAEVELRLTMAPCLRGPKLALRLQDRRRVPLDIAELGIEADDLDRFGDWLDGAAGMVICAGPTGSGKTTTLYALLRRLADQRRHIAAIEDPPEYVLDGVNQIAVDERHGIDFATGLRALMRMDPDYLMLGEVRDGASAQVLVEAANSGRVALTSLHSRDAIGAVTQLRNWRIPDHVIAVTASLVVAQRLVPRLCPSCAEPAAIDDGQRRWLERRDLPEPTGAREARGCERCDGRGRRGRRGLFEVWAPDPDQLGRIRAGDDETRLRERLATDGHRDLLARGFAAVDRGEVALDDLRRASIPVAATRTA